MSHAVSRHSPTNWAVRIIPFFIFGAFVFAKYAVIAHLCVNYLYRQRHQHNLAAALITLYFVFFLLAIVCYLRTFYNAHYNQGLVPQSEKRLAFDGEIKEKPKRERTDLESRHPWLPTDRDPDSPGLEAFYSKNMFICEPDGRPRWCSLCWTWKPDRAHHSSELGRCVRKMDHLCPWVGGMVSETSFNFFFQFTVYCTIYLAVCIGTAGYSLQKQLEEGRSLDARIIVVLALAGLFSVFTMGMTLTSGGYILRNITNIDVLRKTSIYHIAVRIPYGSTATNEKSSTITYPLEKPMEGESLEEQLAYALHRNRDGRAKRTFAILKTDFNENPFNLGLWRNFKSVMGNNILEWLLPIRHSPCCNHESMESDYEFGPLVEKLKKRYGLPEKEPVDHHEDSIEMQ